MKKNVVTRILPVFLVLAVFGTSSNVVWANPTTPNPVPHLNPITLSAAAPGGPTFTVTATGTGFVSSSVVYWNGSPLVTTFVTSSKLTATVPAADIANPGTAKITVFSP